MNCMKTTIIAFSFLKVIMDTKGPIYHSLNTVTELTICKEFVKDDNYISPPEID